MLKCVKLQPPVFNMVLLSFTLIYTELSFKCIDERDPKYILKQAVGGHSKNETYQGGVGGLGGGGWRLHKCYLIPAQVSKQADFS